MRRSTFGYLAPFLVMLGISGCQTQSYTPAPVPEQSIQRDLRSDLNLPKAPAVFDINPEKSQIYIRVYSTGRLAKFGHNHVISMEAVTGLVHWHPKIELSGFNIAIPVERMKVDQTSVREAFGQDFKKPVSEKDRQATRRNMLGPKVLDAKTHPFIRVESVLISGTPAMLNAKIKLSIKGVTKIIHTKINLSREYQNLVASGKFQISQQDFDITPFSILGGAIAIQDVLQIDFKLYLSARQEQV